MRDKHRQTRILCLLLGCCLLLCSGCGKQVDTTADTQEVTETAGAQQGEDAAQETADPADTTLPDAPDTPADEAEETLLPLDGPLEMTFASGVGAWSTGLTLEPDGAFTGEFHDSDMGVTGEEYPNGTVYLCTFEGRFTDLRQVDDHTYSLTLEELTVTTGKEENEEWIEDGVLYVASTPYGLEDGTEFLFYTPETPMEGLDEDFLSWWPGRYTQMDDGQKSDALGCYGLWSLATGNGFFTYQ